MTNLKQKLSNNTISSSTRIIVLLAVLLFSIFVLFACGEDNSKKIETIRIEQSSVSLVVGGTQQLSIIITPESATNATVFYSSANSNIATVDSNGLITAVSVGQTTVSVTAKEGGATTVVPVEVMAEPIILSTPTNVHFDGEKIVWDRVDNNYGYEVTLNGVPYGKTINTTYFTDFQAGTQYTVTVRALGNSTTYLTSEYSTEFSFLQYATPSISIESGIIVITPNSDAKNFQILMNGETYQDKITTNQYIIEDTLEVGHYGFQVMALGDNKNTYNSKLSNLVSITKLSAPTNAQVEDKILTFNSVTGAQAYSLKIINNDTKLETYQTVKATSGVVSYDLSDEGYEPGKYTIYIKSIGDNRTTLDSAYSTEFPVDKLSQPQNLKIENGILTWDTVENATGYILQIQFNGQIKYEENIPSPSFNFADKYFDAGEYFIQVGATGGQVEGVSNFVNSSLSQGITVTKLEAPTNLTIKTNNATWRAVDMCEGYIVTLDKSTTLPEQTNNYINFNDTDTQVFPAKNYVLQVKAVGNGTTILDSEYSSEMNFKKLGQVETEYVTLSGSSITWQSVGDAIVYNVFINDSTSPMAVSGTTLDMSSSSCEAGNYSITIQAISTASNAVNGEKSQPITFTKLPAPSNFRIDNGILTYSMPDGTSYLGYNVKVGKTQYTNIIDEYLTFDQYLGDDNITTVSLQAIGDGQSTISSNFSQDINIHKVSSSVNLIINNDILSWDAVSGATAYQIFVDYTNGDNSYSQTMEVSATDPTMLNLLTTNLFDTAGLYTISLKAIGTTLDVNDYSLTYDINSKLSQSISTRKLADISNLYVRSGLIGWDAIEGVSYYEVVVDGVSKGNCGTQTTYEVDGDAGAHNVRVYARGNKSSVLDANNPDNTITVTKLSNVYSFTLRGSTVMWSAIQYAYSYDILVVDSQNNVVKKTTNIASTSYEMYGVDGYNKLYIKIKANGDNNSVVNGNYGALPGDKYFEVTVLSTPKNLHITDNILYFDYVNGANVYELVINFSGVQDKQTISAVEGQTQGAFDLGAYLSGKDYGVYSMFMNASDALTDQQCLSSAYTNVISVEKLGVPVTSVLSGEIYFTKITNADSYQLSVQSGVVGEPTNFVLNKNDDTFSLDTRFVAGEYSIFIQAVGDGTRTISSEVSSAMSVVKLSTPTASQGDIHDLELKNGKIVWNAIDNAYNYKFVVYKYDAILDDYVEAYTNYLQPSVNNEYLPSGSEGNYRLTIQVMGDDSRYLNSDVYEYNKVLQKLKAPDNVHINMGVIEWSNNAQAENGYSMVVNDNEFDVGSVNSYELTGEKGFSGGVDYSVMVRTIGNSDNRLSSDLSDMLNARKLSTQVLKVENGKIVWESSNARAYHIVVKSLDDVVVESFEITDLTYMLESIDTGFYYVTVRAMGSDYVVDATGYLNADASTEMPVYKMATPTDLKINSEFNSSSIEELMRIGYLEWSAVDNANSYNVQIFKSTAPMAPVDVDTPYYNISSLEMIIGRYDIEIYANGSSVLNEDISYSCITSDQATMAAYKLDAPTNLSVQNGVFYWDRPASVEGVEDLQLQYMFYYNYAPIDQEFDETQIIPKFTGTREFQTLFGLGKYRLSVCAVADNCIRSNITSLEDDYVFDLFKSGSGTMEDPYVIETFTINPGSITQEVKTALSQLEYVNYLYDKHFIIKEDITIDSTFKSLGTKDELSFTVLDDGYNFEGTIDGDNHTIIFDIGEEYNQAFGGGGNFGFIYRLGQSGVVKNLNFSNFVVAGSYSTIGIVTPENYGTIDNVKVISSYGGIISSFNGGNVISNVGGIVGINYGSGKITNSTSKIIINATNSKSYVNAGGVVGHNQGLVENCQTLAMYDSGLPMPKQITGTIIGGIVGYSEGDSASIIGCVNYATVDARASSGEYGSSSARAGGIVGLIKFNGTSTMTNVAPYVTSCYNVGTISALENGSQTVESSAKVGGLVGFIQGGTVDSCYNVGDTYLYSIDSMNQQTISRDNVGAIIGWNNNTEKSSVLNSFYINLQGMPLSCTIALKTNEMQLVTEEQLKADAVDENSILSRLNKSYNKFVYNANGYPKLSWEA